MGGGGGGEGEINMLLKEGLWRDDSEGRGGVPPTISRVKGVQAEGTACVKALGEKGIQYSWGAEKRILWLEHSEQGAGE